MVSAKFHIIGQSGDWLRIRAQEEIHAHGLEGSVLVADENTLAVVVEGDKAKVKRLYTDLVEVCPEGVGLSELTFSLQKQTRRTRILDPARYTNDETTNYLLEYLREIEKKTTRIDQKLDRIISMLEGGKTIRRWQKTDQDKEESFEKKDMEVDDDASSGFAAMFG